MTILFLIIAVVCTVFVVFAAPGVILRHRHHVRAERTLAIAFASLLAAEYALAELEDNR